jgi:predicted amino acid racemase
MDTNKAADRAVTKDELVIGQSDVVEDVPAELLRVMAGNSAALERLPAQRLIEVASNLGQGNALEEGVPFSRGDKPHGSIPPIPDRNNAAS